MLYRPQQEFLAGHPVALLHRVHSEDLLDFRSDHGRILRSLARRAVLLRICRTHSAVIQILVQKLRVGLQMPQESVELLVGQKLIRCHQLHAKHRSVHEKVPLHDGGLIAVIACAYESYQAVRVEIGDNPPAGLDKNVYQPRRDALQVFFAYDDVDVAGRIAVGQPVEIAHHRILGISIEIPCHIADQLRGLFGRAHLLD